MSASESLRRNPYRIFFPLGILAGLYGVGIWAFWTVGIAVDQIKLLHITLQSQGFLTLIVAGFLLTALPRFSGTASAQLMEITLAAGGAALFLYGEWARSWRLSQTGFLLTLAVIPIFAGRRVPHRTKDFPPSFFLLAFGLLHGFLGGIFSLLSNMGETHFYLFTVGRQMVQVGFLLCMVLGITAKLAPFLMGYTGEPDKGTAARADKRSGREMGMHALTGALLLASFFVEPWAPRSMAALRAFCATAHLLAYARIGRPLLKKTVTIRLFWISCWSLPIGLWTAFFLPDYRVAALHIVFIGGFSLMIFSFGMLVVLSHSGQAALLNGKLWSLRIVGFLTLLAVAARVLADFWPAHYMMLLHSAAGFWVIGAAIWLGFALLKMRGQNKAH